MGTLREIVFLLGLVTLEVIIQTASSSTTTSVITTDSDTSTVASTTTTVSTTTSSVNNYTLTAAQTYTKILGRSGKIVIGRNSNESDADKIQITFDEINEIDNNGSKVGTSGSVKHSFNTFANLDFTFSSVEETSFAGITAERLNFTANINSAMFMVQVYIFTNTGVINIDGEKSQVTAGTVKFNIMIKNWQFCDMRNNCMKGNTPEIGNGIEFVITIKGNGTQKQTTMNKMTDGEEFTLGESSYLFLSRKVMVDDRNYVDMTTGYPQLTTKGEKKVFVFRFPKFNSSILYDPQIMLTRPDNSNGSSFISFSFLLTCLMIIVTKVLN